MRLLSFAIVLAATVNTGCDSSRNAAGPESGASPSRIVTTCGMVTDIVRIVAGDNAQVVGLLGEGVDPHLYSPGRNDVRELAGADVVFYSGLLLEAGMQRVLQGEADKGKRVFAVTDALDKSYLLTPPEFEGHPDPHVWMDVSAWSQCVPFVAQKLAEFDSPNADRYLANAAQYRKQLDELDGYVKQVIATIPESQRHLVTAHDAFGYFARAYGLEVHSVQGISTQSEAAVADINDLVDFMVKTKVPAIFVESSVPQKNIQAVIEGCANRGWKVSVGGELFSDAMGAPGTYEGTYLGMIDHNATTIARALGGEAPPQGWQGKLKGIEIQSHAQDAATE